MKKNNRGFTLAELLIVVAIIAVLVAIAIPVFTGQLNKSKYGVDEANARSIYAEMAADFLANGANGQSAKFKVEPSSVAKGATGDALKVKVTEADGTTNTYTFNGMTTVTFTVGVGATAPTAKVAACDYNNNKDVDFGITGTPAPGN